MAETKTQAARPRGSALNTPMAALAGGSAGFFTFAMPAALFERLIGVTGLPGVIAAAQPPLGDTARLGAVAVVTFTAFALTWLLLRRLDRKPIAAAKPLEASNEPPRLRRADMHPDAPSRRPVLAATDLGVPLDSIPVGRGEPVDVSEIENVDFEAEWERPAPRFLTAANEQAEEAEDELLTGEQVYSTETYDAPSEPEPVDVPFWMPDGAQEPADNERAPEIESLDAAPEIDGPTILPFWAQHTQNDPVEEKTSAAEPSLDQLSDRLEGGLLRRKRDGRSTRPRGHRGVDDRLRVALDDLTKVTGRR